MYMDHVCFYVCCSDCVGVCGIVCCVAAVVKDSVFLALECRSMFYICVKDVRDVVFSVCIVRCLCMGSMSVSSCCLVCIMWQFLMLRPAFVNLKYCVVCINGRRYVCCSDCCI